MKTNIKRALMLFLCAVVLLSAAACASNAGNAERRNDTSNTLYVGYVGTSFPSSFMPWQSRDGIAPTVSSMIYSTLFIYEDMEDLYTPSIADSWCYTDKKGNPLLDEDGKIDYTKVAETYAEEQTLSSTNKRKYMVVRIELNENARWTDGEPVTVEDVYFSFDLCANNKMSNHAGGLAWVADLKHKYHAQTGAFESQGMFTYENNPHGYPISEEEKDTVMYLHVDTVMGAVASLFTTVLILPEHIWAPVISYEMPINSTQPNDELTNLYRNPVGCGPYKLVRDETNSAIITLQRNDDYHMKAEDGGPLYQVEKIKFILYQEQNVAIFAIKKGYIDILDSSIPANYGVLFEGEENMEVLSAGSTYAQTLVFNLNPVENQRNPIRSLLGNKDVRKAIALAINQEELIDDVLDGAGETFSPGLVSSAYENIYNPESDILRTDYEQRLAEANRLLDGIIPQKDSMGYRVLNGQRVKYEILTSPGMQDCVGFLQIQLQRIGIEVVFAAQGNTPESTYFYNSRFDMTIQGVSLSASTIDIMANSHFVNLGKTSNYGRLENAELAAKINKMRNTLDLTEKYNLIKELQVDIANEYYKVPLYSSNVISVVRTDRYVGYIAPTSSTAFSLDSLRNMTFVGGGAA